MAEGLPASPPGGAGSRGLHSAIVQWLVDNFCVCEGYSVPRCLMYEIYVETCGQNAPNQVNPATFGKGNIKGLLRQMGVQLKRGCDVMKGYIPEKGSGIFHFRKGNMVLVHLVFPDLGTRRLGTRGSARYHYDGIYIKKSSFFYAQYCYLLGEKSYHRWRSSIHKNRSRQGEQLCGDATAFEKPMDYNNMVRQEETGENLSPVKTDSAGSSLSEFRRCPLREQELAKKYSYKMMVILADDYCNYCQDILQNVRNQELEKVEDLLTSYWRSLQQDIVVLMSLPDVRQLLRCYDIQMYKGIEKVLLGDFLQDVSIQYLKSVRIFSKKFKLWLLNALEGFPPLLQISKLKEVTVFVKRLRRKTYLSNMAKTMRLVLKNNTRVSTLKSDLSAIIKQGALDISRKALASDPSHAEELESHIEMQCLSCLISLLGTSTDLSVFLNCLSSNLQAFVFQPSRSKEEFIKLAANFQLRWNFLLTAVSRAMTLCHRESFGSWHLFHLLLLEYVIHILQSCLEEEEEEEEEESIGCLKDVLQDDQPLAQPVPALFHPVDSFPAQECAGPSMELPWVTLKHISQNCSPLGVSSMVLRILGFLVDTATGNKIIQVLLEDKATESAIKLSLPVGQEALITLNDGQKFVIHISDVPQSSEENYFGESNANTQDNLFE